MEPCAADAVFEAAERGGGSRLAPNSTSTWTTLPPPSTPPPRRIRANLGDPPFTSRGIGRPFARSPSGTHSIASLSATFVMSSADWCLWSLELRGTILFINHSSHGPASGRARVDTRFLCPLARPVEVESATGLCPDCLRTAYSPASTSREVALSGPAPDRTASTISETPLPASAPLIHTQTFVPSAERANRHGFSHRGDEPGPATPRACRV